MAIKRRPIFEWYVISCGFKIGNQKGDMCSQGIGLCAQNMLAIVGSIVDMIGGPIWPFNEHEKLHFDHK